LINALREHYPVNELCEIFDINRSSYYYREKQRMTVDAERERLKGNHPEK